MAIKRRPTDEDDDERPRRRSRPTDDAEDEEDEDRPRRRRSRDEDDEEDDDDRPVRRKSRDDDEDDEEDRPRRRRRSREDEEDEEDDDDRPRRRRRKRDDDETVDEAPSDNAETKKPSDKTAKPGDKKAAEEDPEYLAWIKKKAQKRKQFLAASEGMQMFAKRAKLFLMLLAVVIGFGVLARFLLADMLGEMTVYVSCLILGVWVIVPTAIGMQAAKKCRQGPPKMGGESNLGFEPIVDIAVIVLFGLGAACFFLLDDDIKLYGAAGCFGLGGFAYIVSFINEIMYLKVCGKYLKDKIRVNWASSAVRHFVIFDIVAVPAIGAACFFLHYMGQLGLALAGVLVLGWLIMVVKGFLDIGRIVEGLRLTISKQLMAEDKPNW